MSPLFKVTMGALLIVGAVVWILSELLEILTRLIQVVG